MQNILMKFDPATGKERPYPSHAAQWRNWFNARDVRCVLEGGEAECFEGDVYEKADPLYLYDRS